MHQAFDARSGGVVAPENTEAFIVYRFHCLSGNKGEVVEAGVGIKPTEKSVEDVWETLIKKLIETNALQNWSEISKE